MMILALVALATCLACLITVDGLNPQWSWIEEPASYFVNGRAGWLTTVALLSLSLSSALVTGSALGAARGKRPARGGQANHGEPVVEGHRRGGWPDRVAGIEGTARGGRRALAMAATGEWRRADVYVSVRSLGIWSAAVLVAAVFPADPPGHWDRPLSASATVHGLAGNAAFVAFVVAAVPLTWSWRDGRLGRALLVAGTAAVIAFVLFAVTLVDVFDGPSITFGPYEKIVGLTERLTLLANVVWLGIVAVRLRRVRVTA